MSKISALKSIVDNGWTIANRKAVTSRIGKSNFHELATLARKSGLPADCFEYSIVKDELKPNKVMELKDKLISLINGVEPKINMGTIYKKVKMPDGSFEKRPIDVHISANRNNEELVTYDFFDGDKCVGFVQLEEHFHLARGTKKPRGILLKDYPELGVTGDRVIVHMLQNFNEAEYSGIGLLADKIAVEHCLKQGIEPNIVSEAAYKSHVAHYLRGKRFIPFKGVDYNKEIEKLVDKRTIGEHIDTSDYGTLFTYMPREMISRLKKEVLQHPIMSGII